MGICQHSLPQPEEKGGVRWLPVGPAASLRPAPEPNRDSRLAKRAARRLCVKCRLREVPYNRGLGSPPARELGAARCGAGASAMELNSLLILLEAAEYLERRDRGTGRRRAGGRSPAGAPGLCCEAAAGGPGRGSSSSSSSSSSSPGPHLPGRRGADPGFARGTALGEEQCASLGLFSLKSEKKRVVFSVRPWTGMVCVSQRSGLLALLRVWQSVTVWQCPPQRSVTGVGLHDPPRFQCALQ